MLNRQIGSLSSATVNRQMKRGVSVAQKGDAVKKTFMARKVAACSRALAMLGLALVLVLVVSGLASPLTASAKTTIVHWQHHHEARTPVLEEMAREFEKLHPDVSIRFEPIPYDSYFDKFVTSLSSGAGPDVFQVPMEMGPEMVRSSLLAPVPADVLTAPEIGRSFLSWTTEQFRYKGAYYGLPTDVQTLVLFINNKLYREAGLTRLSRPRPGKSLRSRPSKARRGTPRVALSKPASIRNTNGQSTAFSCIRRSKATSSTSRPKKCGTTPKRAWRRGSSWPT